MRVSLPFRALRGSRTPAVDMKGSLEPPSQPLSFRWCRSPTPLPVCPRSQVPGPTPSLRPCCRHAPSVGVCVDDRKWTEAAWLWFADSDLRGEPLADRGWQTHPACRIVLGLACADLVHAKQRVRHLQPPSALRDPATKKSCRARRIPTCRRSTEDFQTTPPVDTR